MSGHKDEQTRDRVTTGAGGTVTPTSGSESGTGEKDPVTSGLAEEQGHSTSGQARTPPRGRTATEDAPSSDELSGSDPDAPGYGRPV